MATVEELRSQDAVQEAVDHLRRLVEQGAIEDARRLAPEYRERWPEARAIQQFARVLEPPKVIQVGGEPSRPRDAERAWLKEHACEYPGCWLAVYEDRLVAAGPRLADVLAKARTEVGTGAAILFFQPENEE